MCPVKYYAMIRSKKKDFSMRLHMVSYCKQKGIKETARIFGCSRNTVRKWFRRFNEEGFKGLEERSRAPKTCPHKTSSKWEQEVIIQRLRTPSFSARRMKREFELKQRESVNIRQSAI